MARKCKKESMRAHGISVCEGSDEWTDNTFLYMEKGTGRQSEGAAKAIEKICRCSEDPFLPSLFFFLMLSCAPHTPGISEAPFLSLFMNSSFCFLQQNWLPSVIISSCLCAFTCASQQGSVFGSDSLALLLPHVMWLPIRKFPREVFKLPCRVGFFFWASRFHDNTLTFAFRAVYTASALFFSFLDILSFKQLLQYVSFQLPWRFTQCLQWTELCFQLLPIIFWQRSSEARLCDWWTVCEARFKGKELI